MQTAIASIFVFLLVVLLHELGHFSVAKLVGIKVNEFAIGMGPKILQKRKGETLYTLRILPIGGFVKMEGEDESSSDPRSFNKASPLARIGVLAAGAIMNFVLAIIVLSIVAFYTGVPTTNVEALPNSPAEISGVLSGDRIVSINDINIKTWEDITNTISKLPSKDKIDIVVDRNGNDKTISILPTIEEGRTMIGITPIYQKSLISGIKGGIENTFYFIKLMFNFLGMLFKGQVSTDDFAGPIGVINEVGEAAKMGFISLLFILGFISVNLGFFNLLPIPALDGSKIFFTLIEIIRGKPINPDKEGIIHLVGFVFLISLMLLITYKDILKLF